MDVDLRSIDNEKKKKKEMKFEDNEKNVSNEENCTHDFLPKPNCLLPAGYFLRLVQVAVIYILHLNVR